MNPATLCLNMECNKVNFLVMDQLKKAKWYEISKLFPIVKY